MLLPLSGRELISSRTRKQKHASARGHRQSGGEEHRAVPGAINHCAPGRRAGTHAQGPGHRLEARPLTGRQGMGRLAAIELGPG